MTKTRTCKVCETEFEHVSRKGPGRTICDPCRSKLGIKTDPKWAERSRAYHARRREERL